MSSWAKVWGPHLAGGCLLEKVHQVQLNVGLLGTFQHTIDVTEHDAGRCQRINCTNTHPHVMSRYAYTFLVSLVMKGGRGGVLRCACHAPIILKVWFRGGVDSYV